MTPRGLRSHPELGWLAAVLPAGVRRVRVHDALLAAALAAAGAEVSGNAVSPHGSTDADDPGAHDPAGRPEIEVGPARWIAGDGALAVVPIASLGPLVGSRARRLARRLAASVIVRARAAHAARELRRRGYRRVERITWDVEQFVRLPGAGRGRRRPVERLPRATVVTGRRAEAGPTLVRLAAEDASRHVGAPLSFGPPLATGGGALVLFADRHVLRVGVGPVRDTLARQHAPLTELHARRPPPLVAERVPRPLACGHRELGGWVLEERLPGGVPATVDAALTAQCVDFLVALHSCDSDARPVPLSDAAAVVTELAGARRGGLTELAMRLDDELADLPRGFAHGDFWRKNLLVEGGRLVGVVDWEHAGRGRLPLLDLLQLAASGLADGGRSDASIVVGHLLPWARAGGDAWARGYGARVGVETTPPVLERLVLAFWIDRLARQLAKCGDRGGTPKWVAENVDPVLAAVAAGDRNPRTAAGGRARGAP